MAKVASVCVHVASKVLHLPSVMPSVSEDRTQRWAAGVRSHRSWSGAWSSEKRNRARPSSCIRGFISVCPRAACCHRCEERCALQLDRSPFISGRSTNGPAQTHSEGRGSSIGVWRANRAEAGELKFKQGGRKLESEREAEHLKERSLYHLVWFKTFLSLATETPSSQLLSSKLPLFLFPWLWLSPALL